MIVKDGKNIKNIKKKESIYIMSLDGSYIYKCMNEDIYDKENVLLKKQCSTEKIDASKLFIATAPYSLELIRLDNTYRKEIYKKGKKQYTKSIINVTFDNDYTFWEDRKVEDSEEIKRIKTKIVDKKKLRKELYTNGFVVDGIKYVFYKRGASKARTGSALYIKEDMYKFLMDRSRLIHNNSKKGLYFEEGEICDITSLNAYQSLILSGLEDTLEIDKESILIISDIDSEPFKVTSSVTREVDGVLITRNETIDRVNNMTDGQGLLDESVFELAKRSDKGFMLLRSDFFKCCAFNTKIQTFFEDNKELIKDGKVKDLYRGYIDASKIKLITTPSSVKYLKFKYKFNDEVECYNTWFDNIDNTYGIVKSDKQGNYGTWNRTTYQILNSMPFNKSQIAQLMETELDYITKLRTDLAFFKNHVAIKEDITKCLENDIELIDLDSEEAFVSDDESYTSGEMVNNILSINSDFQYTKIFKMWRIKQIKAYEGELRKGKIRLEDTIYSTIVANPYEMLLHSIGRYKGVSLGKGMEMYCKYYKDGTEISTFRNPHINSGNVMILNNKYHDEYKYFNLTNNVTIINVSDNDMPDRGQGFDYDSDTLLHISNKVFLDVARKCMKYPTPLNMVKGDSKERRNTLEELAILDNVLSNNFIGKIINKSQIINSYMWKSIHKKDPKGLIDMLYNTSSMLSSLSQIELDKAKKSFDNISMVKELKKVNEITFDGQYIIDFDVELLFKEVVDLDTGEITMKPELNNKGEQKVIKRMIVPNFFEYVARDNKFRRLDKFETPMDYLQEIVSDNKSRSKRENKTIGELLVKKSSLDGGVRNMVEQIDNINDIVRKCNSKITFTRMPSCKKKDSEKVTMVKTAKEEALDSINKLIVSGKTMYTIINKCFGEAKKDDKWSRCGMLAMSLLYNSNKLKMLSLFKNCNNINESILVKNSDGYVNIFGERYILTKRLDYKTE